MGEDELEFVVEPKIDGVAVSTTYEGGRFVRAVTRGNGTEGDDITANFALIRNYPKELAAPFPEALEVRGEIYMTLSEFETESMASVCRMGFPCLPIPATSPPERF